jgi:hypothetical protein
MLSLTPSVQYIYEPCSIHNPRGVSNSLWYPYITEENEDTYLEEMKRVVQFRVPAYSFFADTDDWQDLRNGIRRYARSLHGRLFQSTPLLKDPVALFSAEWIADRFDADVIVMIRHPAAFAGSLKKLNWTFDFDNFLQQPLLMRDHLAPFREEIHTYVEEQHDLIDQACLLWRILYDTVRRYREKHESWIFARHKDLANDPVVGFKNLYDAVNLDFTSDIERSVKAHTRASNPVETESAVAIHRDSTATIYNWADRLTEEEVERVRRQTASVAELFYSDEDWTIPKAYA